MIRDDGLESYFFKVGMLIMGGLLIVGVLVILMFFWVWFDNGFVWFVFFVILVYGLIGFVDDFVKVSK